MKFLDGCGSCSRYNRLINQICFVLVSLFWGIFLLGYQGSLSWMMWLNISSLETPFAQVQAVYEASPNVSASIEEARAGGFANSLLNDQIVSTATGIDIALAQYKINLLPLEKLHQEFASGRATVFLLRIQKAASSALDEMFSTHANAQECQPNMRVLEWKDGDVCNQLFNLLHYAEYDPAACGGLTGWDDPAWSNLDCISWIFSYAYEESYRRLPELLQVRLQHTFQSSRLVSGHFMYGIHTIGHRGTFAYVTTIRHPLSRIVSWWNWSIQMGNQRVTLPAYIAFDRFVQSANFPFGGFQKSNHMTRVLCNRGTGIRTWGSAGSEERLIDNTPLERLTEITEEHYRCALHNLQHFAFVFISENISAIEPLTPLLSRFFNMKVTVGPLSGTESNPTTLDERAGMVVQSRLSKATKAKLADLNKWDSLLYVHACALHEVSVARLRNWNEQGSRRRSLRGFGNPSI